MHVRAQKALPCDVFVRVEGHIHVHLHTTLRKAFKKKHQKLSTKGEQFEGASLVKALNRGKLTFIPFEAQTCTVHAQVCGCISKTTPWNSVPGAKSQKEGEPA